MDTGGNPELNELQQLHDAQISGLQQITKELEESNQRLMASEALKSRFLSNIRNEINNPLTVVIGAAANMMHADNPVRMCNQARLIYREAQHLSFQLENIFMAAELESGELRLRTHRVAVDSVLQQVLDSLGAEIEEKQIEIQRQVVLPDEPFHCDEQMLQRIFSNLIHNAIKFSPASQPIVIDTRVINRNLHVSVTDCGTGIPADCLDKIFDRFRQLDEGPCKPHQGHGLGLSVTKAIVDLLEGNLKVQSSTGRGTTVSIQIPDGRESEDIGMDGNELFFDEDPETF